MANVVNGNTIKIDSTGVIVMNNKNILVTCIIVASTADAAVFELQDSDGSTDVDKIRIGIKEADDTKAFEISNAPIVFPNGIKVKTVTNCEATLVFKRIGNK